MQSEASILWCSGLQHPQSQAEKEWQRVSIWQAGDRQSSASEGHKHLRVD